MQLVRLVTYLASLLVAPVVLAQSSGQVEVHVEILPAVLTVTVRSAEMDFGRQRADAGRVELDPSTGEISAKVSGNHRLGEIQLTGPANGDYALIVEPQHALRRGADQIGFHLRWARSPNCRGGGYEDLQGARTVEGRLGATGCNSFRFGGAIDLSGIAEGHFGGRLYVRILSL